MELGDDYILDLQSKMATRWSSTKLLWSSTKLIWSSSKVFWSSLLTSPLSLFRILGPDERGREARQDPRGVGGTQHRRLHRP